MPNRSEGCGRQSLTWSGQIRSTSSPVDGPVRTDSTPFLAPAVAPTSRAKSATTTSTTMRPSWRPTGPPPTCRRLAGLAGPGGGRSRGPQPSGLRCPLAKRARRHVEGDMSYLQSYASAFSQYARFSGRTSRRDYWQCVLVNLVVSIAISLFADPWVGGAYEIIWTVPAWALCRRRLHDIDRSGWWELVIGIPLLVVSVVVLTDAAFLLVVASLLSMMGALTVHIVWMATAGTDGTNRYGPDPRDPAIHGYSRVESRLLR